MGCLSELIGIDKVCGTVEGVAYLGDIGVTEKELSDYLSADDKDVPEFLADRARHAERYVISDVLNHFRSVIRPWTFIDRATIGDPGERQELLTAEAGTVGGIVLEVDARSSNVKLLISRLSIYTDTSSAFNVVIRDLSDGHIIETVSLAAPTADQVTYYDQSIEIPVRRRSARFLISHSLASYYKVTTTGSGCSSCRGNTWSHGVLSAYGASVDASGPFIRTSLDNLSHTSGLGLTVTVQCDHSAWVCENKNLMVLPMLYKIGEECVKYGYFNVDRLNNRTLDPDRTKERQNYFAREYGKLMDDVFRNMPLPQDRECFNCNSQIRILHELP